MILKLFKTSFHIIYKDFKSSLKKLLKNLAFMKCFNFFSAIDGFI